ncbi:hypothetical protein ACKUFS_06960 [Pseudomonas cannabina]|uniref:Lipoprotein n=2 Tax=Pseudomonas syringae group TaxID=136849 RepID=A0A8T8C1U4_PSEYM|nr:MULTISPECIES: hypothetical protein [Pseudomonas syringae group]KPB71691.1 Uncharacterized protein AC507_4374 [Pseudomonas syringae pv. maculicola]MBM0138417.1 hypothetical protein [Pseudomonas cannabina pv. alisalensis]QHE97595.1 hypothetical protein PMA4326_013935 [Pseudomonas syringae pv. maculicola str. ES4326]QQN24153.1 hypothetical protein JGS08_11380 [Pseudomonas cannabina pv. alisalensis]UBY98271.1 hypothetical protein LCG56_03745 [Pseudomonas cannabina pv. alisalensis]
MIDKKLAALSLAGLLACVSAGAMAGSTGPTHPDSGAMKVPGTGLEKNVDGTSPGTPGTSPGTKGMDTLPGKKDSSSGQSSGSQQSPDMDDDGDDQDDDKAP